ncbi:M1 family aminopeptidase [Peterkaempfera sp. SMS 1(5)a]|uniref:M1 family aminopeptidase n=1 Tax=Peterkaempfera podocarpi TaxID=3232308 RepID=UPI00366F0588
MLTTLCSEDGVPHPKSAGVTPRHSGWLVRRGPGRRAGNGDLPADPNSKAPQLWHMADRDAGTRRWVTSRAALSCTGMLACLWWMAPALNTGSTEPAENAATALEGRGYAPMALPDENRPVVDLSVRLSPDLRNATGTETIVFTPDARICRVVLRLWPNAPSIAGNGSGMTLDRVTVDGVGRPVQMRSAGAEPGTAGTLAVVPLKACRAAGSHLRITARFRVRLGVGGAERVGVDPQRQVARLGSAFPLLAWVRGRGWVREPAVPGKGEELVSEEFRLDRLAVTAPAGLQVVGGGTPESVTRRGGVAVSTFHAESVRDVAFAVGSFTTATAEMAGVTVRAAVPTDAKAPAEEWLAQARTPALRMRTQFGQLPYRDVWLVVCLPKFAGIEFPTTMFFPDVEVGDFGRLVPHEWGHQYFYSLVGNDQGQDPWLDEAFATYAEAVTDSGAARYTSRSLSASVRNRVGEPMKDWQGSGMPTGSYNEGVYVAGAAALLRARQAAGAAAFDAAIKDYVARNAHSVAAPREVCAVLGRLPKALDELHAAGAV